MCLYKRFLVIFTLLEEQSLFHLQISHSSSGCFTQNGIIFFFSFAYFNEIVKSKCTTPFSKLLKGYISHVIKSSSIAYTFKNTKKKTSESGKEKLFPNDDSFINNLKNGKRNTILTI